MRQLVGVVGATCVGGAVQGAYVESEEERFQIEWAQEQPRGNELGHQYSVSRRNQIE